MKQNRLINIALLAGCVALGLALGVWFGHSPPPPAPQNPAPAAFSFTDTQGRAHALSDFQDKTVILNFWASWCAPCIEEFPRLLRAAAEHPDTVALIALSSDLDEAAMHEFLKTLEAKGGRWRRDNIYIAFDTDGTVTQGQYKTLKLPETLIYGPDLRFERKLVGAEWAYEDLQQAINRAEQSRPLIRGRSF